MSFDELTPVAAEGQLDRFRIIDVREPYEFHGPLGYIEGSELVPLAEIAGNSEKLSGSRPLLMVCRSGKRSGVACKTLQERGVANVTNLAGGMIAWNLAQLPVVRTELTTPGELVESLVAWLAQVTASSAGDARSRIEALLRNASSSLEEANAAALDQVLAALAIELEAANTPPDLALTLSAYRKDLAVL